MLRSKSRFVLAFIFCVGCFCTSRDVLAQEAGKKRFTVTDDIEFVYFSDASTSYGNYEGEPILFSPNGDFFAVLTSRGRLDTNRVEQSLRFYRTQEIEDFVSHSNDQQPPSPVWIVNRSANVEPISNMHWLANSSGVALLERNDNGEGQRIVLADLRKKNTEILPGQVGTDDSMDISDREHYVYV